MVIRKWLVRVAPIFALAALMFVDARPVAAEPASCFEDLSGCYYRAAAREGTFSMWLAGLDCELTFTDCVRRYIIGR